MRFSDTLVTIALLLITSSAAIAQAPILRFSDVDNGPSTGLGDGKGSGTIVTLWGQLLGGEQGTSTINFVDVNGNTLAPAHIYYWKHADGQLPGGPANLYASHRMQEIAFSIPAAPDGLASISVTVNGEESNSLPFRVRSTGQIYWVAPDGNNNNPGTYQSPKAYINGDITAANGGIGDKGLSAGDIVYSRGVVEPEFEHPDGRTAGMFLRQAEGTPDNPISITTYPGTRARIEAGDYGLIPYLSDHINLSKYDIRVGDTDPSLPPDAGPSPRSDTHITARKGRYVGNFMGQIAGTCITGWAGAIVTNNDNGENAKMFGNEIAGLGCPNSSRFQHTIYLSVRSSGAQLQQGWDFSFNYMHVNFPMYGIHFYDQIYSGGDCGAMEGSLVATHNVITNQWGPAINIETHDYSGAQNACWSPESIVLDNNIIVNAGLGQPLEDNVTPVPYAIRIFGDIAPGAISIRNNTLLGWGDDTSRSENGNAWGLYIRHHGSVNPDIAVENNVFVSEYPDNFVSGPSTGFDIARNNLFASTATGNVSNLVPNWQANVLADPLIDLQGAIVSVASDSPLIDAGAASPAIPATDVYGFQRGAPDIGAVEQFNPPNPPVVQ